MSRIHCSSTLRLVFLAALTLACLKACAPVSPPSSEDLLPPDADRIWAAFQRGFAPRGDTPFWLKASLNYSGPKESHRSTLEFWGNTELPLRLDFKAGLGITVSMWRIAEEGLVVYYPRKETAYTSPDIEHGVQALGFSCPVSMQELATILTGQAAACIPSSYQETRRQADRQIEYLFSASSRIRSIVLDHRGRLQAMTGQKPYPWTLDIKDYREANEPLTADSYRLQTAQKHKAVVHVKKMRFRSFPWPEEALSLPLPESTTRLPLGK